MPTVQKITKTNHDAHQNPGPRYIVKRDGRKEVFYADKIARAIQAAILATDLHDHQLAFEVAENVMTKVELSFGKDNPTVEDVQDLVEQTLMEMNQFDVARNYIVYRQERSRIRNSQSRLMQTYQGIAVMEAKNLNLKRDNANVDGDTAMGKMLQFGAEGSKEFTKSFLMKPKHVRMHEEGEIHVHDLDFYAMGTLTCCQIDVMDLFERGFSTGHGHIRTPNSIASYAALAAIILQSNQNEQHGGQSIPNFDYAMAKGVQKSYRTAIVTNLEKFIRYNTEQKIAVDQIKEAITAIDLTFPRLKKAEMKKLLAAINQAFKLKVTEKDLEKVISEAGEDVEKQTFQAMEGLIHNLNTMHSRAGAQVPFTSINFGTDTTPEGRLVSLMLLKAIEKGLGKGETAIFPISILKVKEGINYNPKDPNYDIFKRSIEVSAKRLFPNFVFLDAPFNLQYYKPDDYRTEVATMGCRTRVIGSIFPESNGIVTGRGNDSFTTINLVRIALKHGIALGERKQPDWKGFYAELDQKLEEVTNQLLERFEVQANKTARNFPFLMGQGVWHDSKKLRPSSKLREVIKHGTLSIGFIGLAEGLMAMTGEHHGQSPEAQKLGVEIIKHMRERADELSQLHQQNVTLLATPAEGIAGRFTKLDREEYGTVEGVTDREFYTNSFHVPVYQEISAFEKIKTEAPYHEFCNAGHITYIELDGDPSKNLEAFEALVRAMKEAGIGYGSINHPVDRDSVCGFNGIIDGDVCPNCGRADGDDGIKFERIRRITGYLVGTLDRWNDAKQAEERERVKHSVERTPAEKRKTQVTKKA